MISWAGAVAAERERLRMAWPSQGQGRRGGRAAGTVPFARKKANREQLFSRLSSMSAATGTAACTTTERSAGSTAGSKQPAGSASPCSDVSAVLAALDDDEAASLRRELATLAILLTLSCLALGAGCPGPQPGHLRQHCRHAVDRPVSELNLLVLSTSNLNLSLHQLSGHAAHSC